MNPEEQEEMKKETADAPSRIFLLVNFSISDSPVVTHIQHTPTHTHTDGTERKRYSRVYVLYEVEEREGNTVI